MSTRTPRPGIVVEVDRQTPPTLMFSGEGFRLERLPVGSRVVHPNEPLAGIDDVDAAIEAALCEPMGDRAPLPELLRAGMRLTIAFDDISLPLPPMRAPDIRGRIIEHVLDHAAAAGVDDVELIAALALHRRMTEAELRHAVGDRVYDAFAPHGLLYNFDAEDPDGLVHLGRTDHGEEVVLSRRAVESDLVVYVNINLVTLDGGHKSVATGLSPYQALRHHHNVATMRASRSFMDPDRSELHTRNWRQGRLIAESGLCVFQIETTLNTATFPAPFDVLAKREWEWTARDRATFLGAKTGLSAMPVSARRKVLHSMRAPYEVTSIQAGEVEEVHAETIRHVHRQQLVHVEGQSDVLSMGLPYVGPYNVDSIMNPVLVACLGLGYFFNLYRNRPLVRPGGVVIMAHPCPAEFHPVHHPSYIDFFEEVLADTTDPIEIERRYEQRYATDEWYRHLYRTSYAYHGVHPFYMWYWCAHALEHLGGGDHVIVLGGDREAVRRLGFRPASTMADALEIAADHVGRHPSLVHIKNPPLMLTEVS